MSKPAASLSRLAHQSWRPVVLLVSTWLLAGCTAAPPAPAGRSYAGELEVFLEPFDEKGICSVTIGLRNVSGVRQGDANLRLAWFGADQSLLGENPLRMDGLLEERYDAKNLTLQAPCRQVERLSVRSAEWNLFEGWDSPARSIVRIDGVEGTEWQFNWNAESLLFVGTRLKK